MPSNIQNAETDVGVVDPRWSVLREPKVRDLVALWNLVPQKDRDVREVIKDWLALSMLDLIDDFRIAEALIRMDLCPRYGDVDPATMKELEGFISRKLT